MITPRFAVVGHPNKGKSSIVATLAHNDSIVISKRSGTTTLSKSYKVKTEHASFELYDTPGFQRPTKVLAWLQEHAQTADQRANAVAAFVKNEECHKLYQDEVELLKPLVDGAAILYVVDGSRPYNVEYEAEMEILRWTGQPSMALMNPIENDKYCSSWEAALIQYFKTVRLFDPMDADFSKQIELLRVFSHLQLEWSETLEIIIADLQIERNQRKHQSSIILCRLIEDLCHYQVTQKVFDERQAESLEPLLKKRYVTWMVKREKKSFQQLFSLYSHLNTELAIQGLSFPPDLFDSEQWYLWGLNKKQLTMVATIAGATTGLAIDLAVAGSSWMMGALGGGLIGFASAFAGADKLVKMRIKGLPVGGYKACYGPLNNRNFPYVIMGRYLYLYHQISVKNHADRDTVNLQEFNLDEWIKTFNKDQQKSLHKTFFKLSQQKKIENLDLLLGEFFLND